MIEALEDIQAAWDNSEGNRDQALATSLSISLVEDNPEMFADLEGKELPQIVEALEIFRAAGMEEEEWKCQAYLFYKFEPQNIGGTYQPKVRTSNG